MSPRFPACALAAAALCALVANAAPPAASARLTAAHSGGPALACGVRALQLGLAVAQRPTRALAAAPVPAPTPTPTPPPTSTPPPAPTPSPAPPPHPLQDWLQSGDGTISVPVGIYADCTSRTIPSRVEATIDTCVKSVPFFLGHNPGLFTPLVRMGPGSTFTWWDHRGAVHRFRIYSVRRNATGYMYEPLSATTAAIFQTCAVPDGSVVWVYDAAALS